MAAGLPYAIGAQIAHLDRQVVVFTGDGCMSMLMGDLATLAQYNLPVKVVVLNTHSLGLIVWEQRAFLGNPQYGCEIPSMDFAKVAEACGLKGVRIEEAPSCRERLEEGLSFDGPALIEAVVDPDEPPFGETLKPVQAQNIAQAFERGEGNRERMASNLLEEDRVTVSPAVQYAKDELSKTST